ncbi:ABC transporter permease [Clostridium aquiflavi]|uniref:Transport permease protein n=1 Tax=Clostridium aquiflavi TaxID=3073603 RepID=A0ABU1EIQ5_9CLOT|nr:ABC transporter permease [Clostridium sp. 5N-1]MDR5588260.1 ABC transporter permease [Clostridium sp. 5N-1]
MNKNRFIKLILLIAMLLISNVLILKYCNLSNKNIIVSYNLISDKQNEYQLFYGIDTDWSEEKSQRINYNNINEQKKLKFTIPKDSIYIRFDFGNQLSNIKISDIKLTNFVCNKEISIEDLMSSQNINQISNYKIEDGFVTFQTVGDDPNVQYKLDSSIINSLNKNFNVMNMGLKFFICIIIDLLILIVIKKSKIIKSLISEINNNRTLIWNLSKNDFKTKYAGSYLGITWAFVQPIVTILVYWFVFQFGLKAGSPMENVPFIVWFVSGVIPWFFFQEALLNSTNCMIEYSYLVKKVVFKISILPIVKIISALFVHLVFLGFLFIVAGIYKFYPTQYSIQLIYYSFCTFCLTLALSYATSAMIIFFKDLGQLINIFLQVGMWMTPIMWSYTIIPAKLQWIVKLNPMYYIVEGYRDTFINKVWFFERYFQTVNFWSVTLLLFVIGAVIFKKLKPHFADVL